MNCEEKPVLQVKNLTVRYGKGCPQCQTHLEKKPLYRLRHGMGCQ